MAARRPVSIQREVPQKWAAWLNAALKRRGWQQSDLIKAVGLDGEGRWILSTSRVSQWCAGEEKASADRAVLVADALGEDPADALEAINEIRLAATVRAARTAAPARSDSVIQQGLARLRESDLPEHLKKRFEDEYTSLVEPILRANDAAQRKFSDELDEALRLSAQRAASGPGESDAETA
jgi:hypothetical protein